MSRPYREESEKTRAVRAVRDNERRKAQKAGTYVPPPKPEPKPEKPKKAGRPGGDLARRKAASKNPNGRPVAATPMDGHHEKALYVGQLADEVPDGLEDVRAYLYAYSADEEYKAAVSELEAGHHRKAACLFRSSAELYLNSGRQNRAEYAAWNSLRAHDSCEVTKRAAEILGTRAFT